VLIRGVTRTRRAMCAGEGQAGASWA